MPFKQNTFFHTTRITVILVFASAGIGIMALTGWIFDFPALKTFQSGWASMKVNTALAIIFSAASILVSTTKKNTPLAEALAVLVFLIGTISLGQILFNWNAGIDELFLKTKPEPGLPHPGRMGPITAFEFVLLGISLFAFSFKRKILMWLSEISAIMVLITAVIGFTGYLYDSKNLYTIPHFTSTAFYTTLALLFISLGILFAKPATGVMSVFNEKSRASKLGTWQILSLVVILFVFGWLCLKGYEAGLYDMQFGLSAMIILFIIIFFFASAAGIQNLNIAEKEGERLYKIKEESDAFSRGILSSLVSHVGVMDHEGTLIAVNSAWEQFSKNAKGGLTLDRPAKGSNCLDIYKSAAANGNEFAARALKGIFSVLNKETRLFELRYPCYAREKECWYQFRVMSFEGDHQRVVMSHLDITEIMKQRIRAEKSESNLKQIMDNSLGMIASISREHRLIAFNKALYDEYKFFSGSVPEPGIIHYKVFPPEAQEVWKSKIDEALSGKTVKFERSYEAGGQKRHVEVFLYPIRNDGEVEGVTCFVMNITERKKAEELLKKNEFRLNEAQRIAHIGSWELDLENNILNWSDEIYRIFEIDPQKFGASYEAFLDAIHPGDREMMNNAYSSSLKNKTPYNIEHRLKFPDGRIKYLLEQCETFYNESGKPVRSLGTVQDITERKRIEAEKEKLLSILQKSLNEIYIFNADSLQFEYVNNGALQNLGYSMEAMSRMTPLDIKPEYTLAGFRKLIAPLINYEKEKILFATVHKRADGSLYPVEIHLQLINHSSQSVFLAVILDITIRKKAEQQLRDSEKKLREITASLPGIVYQYVMDASGKPRFTFLSDGIRKYQDDTAEEIYNDSNLLFSKVHPDDVARLMSAIVLSNKKMTPLTIAYRILTTDGDYRWMRSDSIPVLQEDGTILRNGSLIDITEAREAEEKLGKSETKFKKLVENIHESLIVEDTEGRLVYANSEFGKMFGYSEEEFSNLSLADYTSPESYKEVLERHNTRMKGLPAQEEFEYKALKKDGSEIWIECRVSTLTENGKIIGTQSLEKDITDRKLAEERLKESEGKYRALMQQAGDLIVLFNSSGLIIEANEAAKQVLGYKEDEFKNLPLKDFFFNEDLKKNPLQFDELSKGLSTISRRKVKRKGGGVLELEIHSRMLPDGNFIGVGRDLTERIKAEQLLRESEEKYRSIVEKNPAGIYQTTPTGKIITCNTAFAHMFGYSPEFLHHQDAGTLYFSQKEREEFVNRLKEEGELINREIKLKHRDGNPVFLIESCFLQTDALTGEQVIEGVVIDITKRKLAEESLIKSEDRYRSLIEQASDGILVADFQGNILEINSALCTMFGYSRQEIVQKKTPSFIDPESLKLKPFRFDLLSRDNPILQERRAIHKNGSRFDIEMNTKLFGEGLTMSIIRDISERKKAEEQVRLSEEKYRSFFDQSADAIFIFDEHGRFSDVNSVASKLLGYTRKEFRNMSVFDIVFKKDLAANPVRLDLLATGKSVIRQRTFKRKDGTDVEVEVHSKKLPGGSYLGMVRDITGRKIAEEALKQSEEKYRTIISTTDEMMQRLSADGKIIWVNESWKKNMAVTDKEVIGKKLSNFLDGPTRIEFGKVFPQLMKGNKVNNLSCGFITKKGEVIFLEGQALPVIDNGKITGSQAFLRNVTERKKAEEQIREQEARFRALVDTAPDATVIADEKGIIRIANLQAAKLFGYTKAELTSMSVDILIPQSSQRKHKNYRRQYTNNPHTRPMGTGRELLAVRKDGKVIPVEISLSPFHSGEAVLVTASIRDITQRKKAEKELEESYQSVRRLTEYLQNVREEERTHIAREIHDELGQQLTVMMMDVSWLERKIGRENIAAQKKIAELFRLLDNTIKTIRKISTELRPSVLDDLGLVAAMSAHLEEFEKRSGIHTQLKVPAIEPELTDPAKNGLFRIFQESLTNVARHSGAKKVIIKIIKQKNSIMMLIEDDGNGFNEEKAATKKTLGVLGMRERAAMMGGEYSISGKPGVGTTVQVSVPLTNAVHNPEKNK